MTSFIYSNNTLSKSSTNLTTHGENININNNNSNNNTEEGQHQEQSIALNSNSSSLLMTSSLSSSLSATNTDNEGNRHSPYSDNSDVIQQQQHQVLNNAKILKKSLSINSDNTTYMNFVLAQIGVYFIK